MKNVPEAFRKRYFLHEGSEWRVRPELRSLISFLNIGTAGFVLSALGLRFTFPAVSLEGRAWWIARTAPVTARLNGSTGDSRDGAVGLLLEDITGPS